VKLLRWLFSVCDLQIPFEVVRDPPDIVKDNQGKKTCRLNCGVSVATEKSFLDFAKDKLQDAKNPCSDTSVIEGGYQYFKT